MVGVYLNEAVRLVLEGASIEEVDRYVHPSLVLFVLAWVCFWGDGDEDTNIW